MSSSPADLQGLSPETIQQLQLIANEKVSMTTVAFMPVAYIVYLCILYFSAKATDFALHRISRTYASLTPANKKTTTVYVLNVIFTATALATQLVAMPMLRQEYTKFRLDCVKVSGVIITGLYLFELIYRESMRWPMLLHHFSTIFAMSFVVVTLERTMHPSIIVTGTVWLFQATTEQSIFVGLFLYRLKFKASTVTRTLRFAAIQSFIPKFVFAIYVVVWFGVKQAHEGTTGTDLAFDAIVILAIAVLQFTQVYGSWVVWKIASDVERRYNKDRVAMQDLSSEKQQPVASGVEHHGQETQDREDIASFKTVNQSAEEIASGHIVLKHPDLEKGFLGTSSASSQTNV